MIEPQLDPATRSVGIVARVANPDELLRPGMSATVSVILSERSDALTVPSEAVFVEGGQAFVFVVRPDSVVTRTPVVLGTRQPGTVEVSAGLADGQQVVRAGHQKLFAGAKVMPVGGGRAGRRGAMKLSEISIQRPVFATVMSLAIVLLGFISFTRLPVREYPDIDPPIVSVTTFYRGASPSVVETEITDVLEEQFSTIEAVKTITSSSREQGSVITIEFELNRDVDEAANDVRDRVSRIRGQLPREAEDPIVAKVDVNAQPIIWLALSSDATAGSSSPTSPTASSRSGCSGCRAWARSSSAASGATPCASGSIPCAWPPAASRRRTSRRRSRSENAEIPGGRVEGDEREFAVRTRGELNTPEEFAAIIVLRRGDEIVRLDDIAEVEVGPEDERTIARFNGKPDHRPGHRQAEEGQHPGRGRGGARVAARAGPAAARGHAPRHGLRLVGLHPGLDRRGGQDHPDRPVPGGAGGASSS